VFGGIDGRTNGKASDRGYSNEGTNRGNASVSIAWSRQDHARFVFPFDRNTVASRLDAAHIVPNRLPEGVAEVRNGLAICPTHHRGFDQDFLTITEQYKVVVQRERLRHVHSATTARMLVDFDQRTIVLPRVRRSWPAPEFLRRRVATGVY
jgi:hypothetical protein